jgi:electron transport complex protein RnfB
MNSVLAPILTLTSLGVLFGFSLAYAAKKFHVPMDPVLEKIIKRLPGANCGACGKAGCLGFAQALLAGEMDLHSCSVVAQEQKKDIAEFLGLSLEQKSKLVAILHCCGGHKAKDKYLYEGLKDCLAANLLLDGQKECRYGCLTYETCVKACPFGAIVMTGDGFPRVIEEKCTACGVCVGVCPKQLFSLIPHERQRARIYVACQSKHIGRLVMNVCPVGCIGCRKCEKACSHGAIEVVDNLARIDYSKCNGCLECVAVCPTKVIKVRS